MFDEEMDDLIHSDFDYAEMERSERDPKRHAYAKSLVGKYCVSVSTTATPFLSNLLCKVVNQGDYRRGGNPGQVHIIAYRNKERFEFKKWWLIGGRDWFQCIDSSHLTLTDLRPTTKERIMSSIYSLARVLVGIIECDYKAFIKYKWAFKDTGMYNYLTPEVSLVMALTDTIKAFTKARGG